MTEVSDLQQETPVEVIVRCLFYWERIDSVVFMMSLVMIMSRSSL